MSKTAAQFTAEQQNAAREQIIINTRLTALQAAGDLAKLNGGNSSADDLIDAATKIADFILKDVDAVKPKSTLVIQSNMPPAGAFKPGH